MKRNLKLMAFNAIASTALLSTHAQAEESKLNNIKQSGHIKCGVSTGMPGFSNVSSDGEWSGLNVAYCQGLATAVFGDTSKVNYLPLTAKERFTALQSGEVDVLADSTTWTYHRDTGQGLNFVGTNYYDGQGFMVKKESGITSAKELAGATVCLKSGTTTELNLADYFRSQDMSYQAVVFDTDAQILKGFDAGRCDVLTTDQSGLYALKLTLKKPESTVILPEIIYKEPLGPVVSQEDDQWFNIARWTLLYHDKC